MVRSIVGVVVGIVVAMAVVMATFVVGMTVLGREGTFRPGTYWTTDTFNVVTLIGGTIGAALGGLVCGVISRSRRALLACVGLIVVFGALDAVRNFKKPEPPAAVGTPTLEEIKDKSKEPNWYAVTKVALSVFGLLAGGWGAAGRRGRDVSATERKPQSP